MSIGASIIGAAAIGTRLIRFHGSWISNLNSTGRNLMYKKNTAIVGFSVGLISKFNGADITTGIPVGYYTLDGGVQAPIADVTPVHEGNGLWSFDISAAEMNGDIIALTFTHTNSITEHRQIKPHDLLVDDIWDEALSGHNVGGTTGKALKQLKEGTVSAEASVNDAGATPLTFITSLTEITDNHYIDVSLVFIDGDLIGQSRPILSYDGTTKTITLEEALTSAPADGDTFIIKTDHVHPVSAIQAGLASSADLATIKTKTDQMVFTKVNELDTNTKSINGAGVIGDGNITPWDGE